MIGKSRLKENKSVNLSKSFCSSIPTQYLISKHYRTLRLRLDRKKKRFWRRRILCIDDIVVHRETKMGDA